MTRTKRFSPMLVILGVFALLPAHAGSGTPWEKYKTPIKNAPDSVGKYNNGCLIGGVPVPTEGPGYQVVRLARTRNYAHPEMRDFLMDLGRKVERADIGLMLVADVAMPRGGRFAKGHRSHQTGLDADIWLRLDAPRLPVSKRQKMYDVRAELAVDRNKFQVNSEWGSGQEKMIKMAAKDPRVARIFVHPAIKAALCSSETSNDREWLRTVRPWWGHDSHFHVRLHCQGDDCVAQSPPPAGDGCGKELYSWWPKTKKASKPKSTTKKVTKPKKRYVPPPAPKRCQMVLKGQHSENERLYAASEFPASDMVADRLDTTAGYHAHAASLPASKPKAAATPKPVRKSLKLLPPAEIHSRAFVNHRRR